MAETEHTYEELHKKTVADLREIAKGLEHERSIEPLHLRLPNGQPLVRRRQLALEGRPLELLAIDGPVVSGLDHTLLPAPRAQQAVDIDAGDPG